MELPHINTHDSEKKEGISRRGFLKMAAVATATAILYPGELSKKDQQYWQNTIDVTSENFDPRFIHKTIEKQPFAESFAQKLFSGSPAQKFFAKWCEINDSIIPQFVSREVWVEKGKSGFLEKNDQGKNVLTLPEDLQLWEMMEFIKTVDSDTFSKNPELHERRAKEITKLGHTFQKAGAYLLQYLPEINEGKDLAKKIGDEFYSYGLALQRGRKTSDNLSDMDKTDLDEWFLGKQVYTTREHRLKRSPEQSVQKEDIENRRKELLKVFFRALSREGYERKIEGLAKTIQGPIKHLHEKTKEQIIRSIETPERELKTSIFRRGVELLKSGMGFDKLLQILIDLETKEKHDQSSLSEYDRKNLKSLREFKPTLEWWKDNDYSTLHEALKVPRRKAELEETWKTGDMDVVSKKELEIAKIIERAVSRLPYKLGGQEFNSSDTVSGIIKGQFVNCVGASMLGGALLDEIGIKYLHASLPNHSLTLLVTQNGKVYWQDFLGNNINFREVENKDIAGNKFNGQRITIDDLVLLSDTPTDDMLIIGMNDWYDDSMMPIYLEVSRQEIGLQCEILGNLGSALTDLGKNDEAVEALRQAINIAPNFAGAHNNLGNALYNLGKKKEAVAEYRKFVQLRKTNTKLIDRARKIISEEGVIK